MGWWARRKAHRVLVESETTALIREHGAEAYRVARDAARLAREKGEPQLDRYFGRVALRIADITGRVIGKL